MNTKIVDLVMVSLLYTLMYSVKYNVIRTVHNYKQLTVTFLEGEIIVLTIICALDVQNELRYTH